VEKEDFNATLLSRFDVKVSMNEVKGYDGATIVPPAPVDFTLRAKEIVRKFRAQNTEEEIFNPGVALDANPSVYVQPNTAAADQSEIEEAFLYPLGVSELDPVANEKYNYKVKFAGVHDFHIQWDFLVSMQEIGFTTTSFQIKTFFRHNITVTQIGSTISGTITFTAPVDVPVVVNGDFPAVTVAPGDLIYFYTVITFGAHITPVITVKQNSINVQISALERTADTACTGWMIFDAIDQCIKVITNGAAKLKSSFLSLQNWQQPVDGQGSLYIVTNGKQIRRFNAATSPLKISLSDLLTSKKNIHCLGYSVERAGAFDHVRVERVNYFYQNREMLVIDHALEYREEVAKDMLYNELEFGYDRFQDSGYNTLDEFNTRHEHVTPVKTNKLKLSAKSSLIASGYSIEDSRRQQFAQTATDSYQNDEDGFLISVRRIFGGVFFPEADEAFQTVTNLISPSTAYNLRISPFRMMLNWLIWLRGALFFKQPSEEIKNTFVAQNGELVTQFLSTEDRPVGDITLDTWQEKQDLAISEMTVEEELYRPEYIFFKAKLTPDKIQIIDESMRGNWNSATNYGYIAVLDETGSAWLLDQAGMAAAELEYNFHREIAQFKLLKKHDSPVVPGAGCCQWLTINGCHVLINGEKVIL
jgi:hypothetical protein